MRRGDGGSGEVPATSLGEVIIHHHHAYNTHRICFEWWLGDSCMSGAATTGIYPNALGEGIGRGHWFALIEMAAKFKQRSLWPK